MIRPINHNPLTLQQPSVPATKLDSPVLTDLIATLQAHADEAVGMAANMIGVNKQLIAVQVGPLTLGMMNPQITHQAGPYQATEGCLSLSGERTTTRYQTITVTYEDEHFQAQRQTFTGLTAQIIQHEVDHCRGILI